MNTCIRCGGEATKRLTPDMDIEGVPVCDACADSVKIGLLTDDDSLIYGNKKPIKRFLIDTPIRKTRKERAALNQEDVTK